ncbi:odorant receptor 67c-like [Rhynchophorus ferrugineus]|uniref:odorant receptor 67c-like n=1 Tax=Rhynchophorus ferrugineus TaxID=354439 RepID=UPI003FCCF319
MSEMSDNEQLIKITRLFLILTGFWIKPLNIRRPFKILYFLYAMIVRIIIVLIWILLFVELVRLIVKHYDYNTKIIVSATGMLVSYTRIEIKFAIFAKNNLGDLYRVIIQKEKEIWESDDDEIKKLYTKKIKLYNIFMVILTTSTIFAVFMLGVTGIIGNNKLIKYNRLHNETLETHFLFQFYFPANKLDHLIWYYTITSLFGWCSFLYSIASHMLYYSLLMFSAIQLFLFRMKAMKAVKVTRSPEENNRAIKELIGEHVTIIRFIACLNDRASSIFMIEYFLSSLDIASAVASFSKLNGAELGWSLAFITVLVIQITTLTWNANEIKEQSLSIAEGMFNSDWYLLNKEGRQMVQIIILRAQKPLVVTIGPFGPMTTHSALVTFKAAYSYVNLMK